MDACQARIASATAVKVDFVGVGSALNSRDEEVADATRLEGAGGLEVLELEEDSASTV